MKNAYFLTLFLISACVAVAEETPPREYKDGAVMVSANTEQRISELLGAPDIQSSPRSTVWRREARTPVCRNAEGSRPGGRNY
jgi:hypothetical protein